MEELINRIMTRTGVDEGVAKDGLGIVLGFLKKATSEEKMQEVFDALPGAADLVAARAPSGGLLGGLGNMMGGGTMGAMAALGELNKAGLGMKEIQGLVKELVSYAKQQAGDEAVDEMMATIPGLSQIV